MTVAPGSHVALCLILERALHGNRLVHHVRTIRGGTYWDTLMVCGVVTTYMMATEHVTRAPLSCVWCIAGVERFAMGPPTFGGNPT